MKIVPSLKIEQNIQEELLMLLARHGKRQPLAVFLGAAMISAVVSKWIDTAVLVSWLFLVAVVLGMRWIILGRLPKLSEMSLNKRIEIAIWLSAINGVTHALSLGFFQFIPEFERAIQSLIMIAICTGAVATTVGYLPIYLAYTIPIMIPLSLLWMLSPGIESAGWAEVSMGLLMILFGINLVSMAKDSFRLFRESLEIRFQQANLNKQLQAALDKAESASRSKTRFLAAASHDLRQPLHTLALFGAALSLSPLDERSREIADHMDKALQALTSQMDALLDISKLDAGVISVNLQKLNLHSFLERLYTDFLPLAEKKGLELRFDCEQDVFVVTDPTLFERIVRNLLANALKFTDSGFIAMKVVVDFREIRLTITDSGHGIPKEQQEHVFEEFFQMENSQRDRTKGLGLGLAIVRRLTNLLQVGMEMQSKEFHGTSFFLTLPLDQNLSKKIQDSTDYHSVNWHNLRVLVIDDELEVALGMKTLLERLDCHVELAYDTHTAVTSVKKMRPNIILSDLRLKGSDSGLKAIKAIREIYPDLPAVLISGDTSPERLSEAKKAGIVLLHKPMQIDVLTQVIGHMLPPYELRDDLKPSE